MISLSPTIAILNLKEAFQSRPERQYGRQGLRAEELQEIETTVAPILAELEQVRHATIREIDISLLAFIPLGIIAGLVAWWLLDRSHSEIVAVIYMVTGAAGGWRLAFRAPEKSYRDAYKNRIVPHLAARFGDLTYRSAHEPDLKRLSQLGLLPHFGPKKVEDEIHGTYRGIRLSIVEANLETGGKNSTVVFNGLVVELDFPERFSGTTVVTQDPGNWLNPVSDWMRPSGLDRVRLEDPRFEDRYQVYGNDQVDARALLTPAVMERVMELESHASGAPPRLLAEPGRLWVSIPKDDSENQFEPPSLSQPVSMGGEQQLSELSRDLGSVLRLVDAVLELDPLHGPEPVAEVGVHRPR